ncbi:MAG: 3D domain-containing protein [Acidaminococcaceae bacterium]|nr:3D domain-containing protein [Acidaminococcaceae bacterium]
MNSLYRAVSLAAIFWTTVSMSAYTPHETGSRMTASGEKAREGYTCAANFVPIGSVIIYEGHRYYVQDRMYPGKNRHVDIFMESYKKAIEFGRKEAKVQVITPDDKHVKTEIRKKENANPEHNNENHPKNTAKEPAENKKVNESHSPRAVAVLKPQVKP